MHWTPRSLPELRALAPDHRSRALRASLLRPVLRLETWCAFLAFVPLAIISLTWGPTLDVAFFSDRPGGDFEYDVRVAVFTPVFFCLGICVWIGIVWQVYLSMLRLSLRRYISLLVVAALLLFTGCCSFYNSSELPLFAASHNGVDRDTVSQKHSGTDSSVQR